MSILITDELLMQLFCILKLNDGFKKFVESFYRRQNLDYSIMFNLDRNSLND